MHEKIIATTSVALEQTGKFIDLHSPKGAQQGQRSLNAEDIINKYNEIRSNSKKEIVDHPRQLGKEEARKYYDKDTNIFVFDLKILENYLEEAKHNGASHTLLLKACDSISDPSDATPTAVVAFAQKVRETTTIEGKTIVEYKIVPHLRNNAIEDEKQDIRLREQVLEHPGRSGTIVSGLSDIDIFVEVM